MATWSNKSGYGLLTGGNQEEPQINGMPASEYKAHEMRYYAQRLAQLQVEQKGLFPYDATYRGNQYNWTSPTPNGDSVYYGGKVDYAVEPAWYSLYAT